MNCEETRKLMHGWIDRELGLESSLAVEAHLDACGACTGLVSEIESARRASAAAMTYHRAPAALEAGLRRRLPGSAARRAQAWLAVPALGVALAAGWLAGHHSAEPPRAVAAAPQQRVVFHISSRDGVAAALRNVANHVEAMPGARVVIVAHNTGVDFLLAGARDRDGTAFQPAIEDLTRRGVEFRVCGNTLTARGLPATRLAPQALLVPSGIAEISRLQSAEGFAYLKL